MKDQTIGIYLGFKCKKGVESDYIISNRNKKEEMVLMKNGGFPDNRERYMDVHMCNNPNYPDEDPNHDRSLYNVICCCTLLLSAVKAMNCGEEFLVDYSSQYLRNTQDRQGNVYSVLLL